MMSLPCRPFAHGWAFPQEQADTRGTRGPCLNPCQVLRISRNCQWRHCFDTDGLPWQVSNLPRCHPSTHCLISSPRGTAGNWTAAISLMDKSCLPKPPLTLTASIFVGWIIIYPLPVLISPDSSLIIQFTQVSFKDPTPPNTPLVLRSKVFRFSLY